MLCNCVCASHTNIHAPPPLNPSPISCAPSLPLLQCLWAPLAFALGAQYMVQWEVQQVGLNWSNIALRPVDKDPLSFLMVAVILMVDTILYFVATWYIEGVYPGRYGVAKPFYFPFMPSYWFGEHCSGNVDDKVPQDHEMHTISTAEGT